MARDIRARRRVEELLRKLRNANIRQAIRGLITRGVAGGIGLGALAGVLGGILPGRIEPGDLTPEQEREALEAFQRELLKLEQISVDVQGLGSEELQGPLRVNVRRRPGGLPPPSFEFEPPGGSPPGASPSGSSSSSIPTISTRVRRLIRDRLQEIILGTVGVGIISSLRRGSSAPPTVNIGQPRLTVGGAPQPLTRVETLPLTFAQTSPTLQGLCECPPKKKRKRRKCLERAQVEWRTGRFKGKLAGTKCVRFSRD